MGKAGKYKRVPMPPGGESTASRQRWFKEAVHSLSRYLKKTGGRGDVRGGGSERRGGRITVAFPHGIGCGLAGGNWPAYREMILQFAQSIPEHDVIIVKL